MKTSSTRKRTTCKDTRSQQLIWQKNYINEFSKLFQSKQETVNENQRLQAIIERQKKQLKELTTQPKKKATRDYSTQFPEQQTHKRHFSTQYPDPEESDEKTQFPDPEEGDEKIHMEQLLIPNDKNDKIDVNDSATNKKVQKYVCKCGKYETQLKSRLKTHQQEHCSLFERSVPNDLKCPICGIQNTYNAIKSHLLQFTRERKNKIRDERHNVKSADDHLTTLEDFKKKYGPKKR